MKYTVNQQHDAGVW